jgi:hypothetical protein
MKIPVQPVEKGYEDLTENIHHAPPPTIESETIVIPNPLPSPIPNTSMPEQPDSKPSNAPGDNATPSPSNAYTPTTPLSNSPTINSNPEEATDPKDVPAPTDDGDEFVAEDHWLVQKDKLIRVHQKPRYEAFDPSTCCDCPVDILCVSGERFSTGNANQQDLWSHQDTWNKNDSTWQIATLDWSDHFP